MENWKIGDIAIGAKTLSSQKNYSPPPVKKDYKYVVSNVYVCPKCKTVSLDVGFPGSGTGTVCSCNEKIPMKDVHWADSSLFRKLDTRSAEEIAQEIEKKIATHVEKEEYLEAAKLASELKKARDEQSSD